MMQQRLTRTNIPCIMCKVLSTKEKPTALVEIHELDQGHVHVITDFKLLTVYLINWLSEWLHADLLFL